MNSYILGAIVFFAIIGLAAGVPAMFRRTPPGWLSPTCPPALLPPIPIPPAGMRREVLVEFWNTGKLIRWPIPPVIVIASPADHEAGQ